MIDPGQGSDVTVMGGCFLKAMGLLRLLPSILYRRKFDPTRQEHESSARLIEYLGYSSHLSPPRAFKAAEKTANTAVIPAGPAETTFARFKFVNINLIDGVLGSASHRAINFLHFLFASYLSCMYS
jgi:hypothetical protein